MANRVGTSLLFIRELEQKGGKDVFLLTPKFAGYKVDPFNHFSLICGIKDSMTVAQNSVLSH